MYNRISKEIVTQIVNLYVSGWSENRVALHFGYGRRCIRKRLLDSGIHIRNQSEAEALKWSQMSPEQRKKQVKSAHDTAKGRIVSWSTKCKHAKTVELRPSNVSKYEIIVQRKLCVRGIPTIAQMAIGAYNCDIAASPVVVEVWGGNWHFFGNHARRCEERLSYILNCGWFVYILPITKRFPLTEAVTDYLASYIKQIRRDKPSVCEYRMVWGAGDYTTSGCLDNMNFPIVPPFTGRRNLTSGKYERIAR